MQFAMIGLGRMGANMTLRLLRAGHQAVVFDRDPKAGDALASEGATVAQSLQELVEQLSAPRSVFLMVPAGVVQSALSDLVPLLEPGDTVIDGGNSHYQDDIRRAKELSARNLHYVDMGTSGGVWGLERGYCLMLGGETEVVQRVEPLFRALAPGSSGLTQTAGRPLGKGTAEQGYLHCGACGAGHFVKMIHNGIEYGMMAAYAEGFNILRRANIGSTSQKHDAETTPLSHPEHYQYDFDLAEVAEVWRRGSVITSWLLDLTAAALLKDGNLQSFSGSVSDSGEGRWTVQAAIEEGVPAHVLTAALYERFSSRGLDDFQNRVLSAMRFGFGGHVEKKEGEP